MQELGKGTSDGGKFSGLQPQTGKVDIGNSKKGGTLEAKGGDSSGRYVDFQILLEMFGDVIGSPVIDAEVGFVAVDGIDGDGKQQKRCRDGKFRSHVIDY